MACERRADRLAGYGVPQSRCLVRRRAHDAFAVGAERRARDRPAVALESVPDRLAAYSIPKSQRAVHGSGDDAQSIETERGAPHDVFVAFETQARIYVPNPRRLVARCGDDMLPVRAELRA